MASKNVKALQVMFLPSLAGFAAAFVVGGLVGAVTRNPPIGAAVAVTAHFTASFLITRQLV